MLPFLRPELAALTAYSAHPSEPEVLPQPVDHLDTNEYPEDLPEVLKEKLGWLYRHEIAANRYPDGGHAGLRDAIATYVSESASKSFSPEHISVGSGSDELIRSLLIATCIGGSGSILVAQPTFSMYGILARTLGIPVLTVSRREADFSMDIAAAQAAIDQAPLPVRAVFMVHPNSPTANALTEAELQWLQQLPEDVLVVVDEAYFEFSGQTTVAEVLRRPNWVVLRTFSKAFRLAAHRVGYAVANPELSAALEKVRLPYNLPSLTQRAAQLALEHRAELLAGIPPLLAERQRLYQGLQGALQVWPSAANFLYARPQVAPAQMEGELLQLFQRLRQQGTCIRHTGGGLRITVGTAAENQRTLTRLLALSDGEA